MAKRIAVFCSASCAIDPAFNKAARSFVRAMAERGNTIVSGGTIKGTMGEIADETRSCGGAHIGIIPRFMEALVAPGLTEVIWTDTMSERKNLMREGADAVVALPGGIGTLDEFIETMTLRKLNQFHGGLYVLNLGGFYDPFRDLLDYYVHTGMLDRASRDLAVFVPDVETLVNLLDR